MQLGHWDDPNSAHLNALNLAFVEELAHRVDADVKGFSAILHSHCYGRDARGRGLFYNTGDCPWFHGMLRLNLLGSMGVGVGHHDSPSRISEIAVQASFRPWRERPSRPSKLWHSTMGSLQMWNMSVSKESPRYVAWGSLWSLEPHNCRGFSTLVGEP